MQAWLLRAAILLASASVAYASVRAWKSSSAHPIETQPQAASEAAQKSFTPTTTATAAPAGPASEGMVWIPGGEFSMGCDDPRTTASRRPDKDMPDARPIHRVSVDGFWMDRVEVTNRQYAEFVKATGYVTVAERTPTAAEFPDAPPEKLVAGSVVFAPPQQEVPLDNHYQWWSYVNGASWRHPDGPQSSTEGREDYPVIHIAYEDAEAYAKWAGKTAADRDRMGIRGARRAHRKALFLGR